MITLVDALYRNGAERPDKVALIFRDQQVTYGQLLEQATLLGGYLQAQGIQPGDRVMLTGASRPEYVIALLAVQLMGGVTVPVDRNPLKTTLAYIAQLTDAKLYLSTNKKVPEGLPYVRYVDALEAANALGQKAAPPPEDPDRIAELLFTTGTTGRPKGATHTLRCISANMHNTYTGIGMRSDDILLLPPAPEPLLRDAGAASYALGRGHHRAAKRVWLRSGDRAEHPPASLHRHGLRPRLHGLDAPADGERPCPAGLWEAALH